MGCGGVNRTNLFRQNEFNDGDLFKEAYKDILKRAKGLKIGEGEEENKLIYHKLLNNENPHFKEELFDHADESGSVKPWVASIVPPELEIVENKLNLAYDLKIEHVFGYRCYDVRQNIFFVDNCHICYMNGAVGIVQNVNDYSQRIFGGLESQDEGECHDDDIVSIAIYKGEVSMIATGQRHMKPSIMIWSPLDPTVIYGHFHQTKGTKEVSNLEFDKNGEYIASVGKDSHHTFFVFSLETKSLYWKGPTGENFIFDLEFNPLGNEFCIVGVKTVIFLYIFSKKKFDALIRNKKYANETFTAICYTKEGICLTSTNKGSVLIWERCEVIREVKISETTLHNLSYSMDKIFISDSNKNVFICNFFNNTYKLFEISDKFICDDIVKAIDVSDEGIIVLGLKNGTISIKNLNNKNERIITRSHFDGTIQGLEYIPDNFVITTGEDNQIILWNIKTKIAEEVAVINANPNHVVESDKKSELSLKSEFAPNQCSRCVSYNYKFDHVAIGINNGTVSIRNGIRKLNQRLINDIQISSDMIVNLKYSPNMKLLAVSSRSKEFFILDVENNYAVKKKLTGHEDYILQFDWDVSCSFIQAVTVDNNYLFFNVEQEVRVLGEEIKNIILKYFYNFLDPMIVRNLNWASFTCKFGYYVQGIFMGATDPNFINTVACSNFKKTIVTGDDDNFINILNYPCISDNPKYKSY